MKTRFWVILLSIAAGGTKAAAAFDPAHPAASGYAIAVQDDFQTKAANGRPVTNNWEDEWWYATDDSCQAWYHAAAASRTATANGLHLHIAYVADNPHCAGFPERYSDAHLDTYGQFAQAYGYWEAVVAAGTTPGTLTAWWMLPESGAWPPEIDGVEIRGDVPDTAYFTNHWGSATDPQASQQVLTAARPLGLAFHKYGVLVTSRTITWYFDDTQVARMSTRSGEAKPLFPVLSFYTGACGDGWAGCPRSTTGWHADAWVRQVTIWRAP
jgi:beta-glucanase (GH16 family)